MNSLFYNSGIICDFPKANMDPSSVKRKARKGVTLLNLEYNCQFF